MNIYLYFMHAQKANVHTRCIACAMKTFLANETVCNKDHAMLSYMFYIHIYAFMLLFLSEI